MFLVVIITFLDMIDHAVADKITCSSAVVYILVKTWVCVWKLSECPCVRSKLKIQLKVIAFCVHRLSFFPEDDFKNSTQMEMLFDSSVYMVQYTVLCFCALAPTQHTYFHVQVKLPSSRIITSTEFHVWQAQRSSGEKNIPRLSKILLSIHSLLGNNFYSTVPRNIASFPNSCDGN